jgi:hypothetical protein
MSALVEVMRPTRGRGGRKEEIVREDRDWSWRREDILMVILLCL